MENQQSIFAGIDFSQHGGWERVVAPAGNVYYKVPDTGYLYDPFLSASKGKPVLFQDPRAQINSQQAEKDAAEAERQRLIDMQERASSPAGQLLPVAGSAAGLVGAKYIGNELFPSAAEKALGETAKQVATENAPNVLGMSRVPGTAGDAFTQGATGGQSALAPETIASEIPSEPAGMFAPGSLGMNALGAAGVGLGAYGAYQGIKSGNPLTAGLGGAGVWGGLNALGYGLGPAGWGLIAAPAALSLLSGFGDKDMWETERKRLDKLKEDGVFVPEELYQTMPDSRGRSKAELVALEQEKINQGMYGNPEFAQSRNESDLKPQDIVGYSTFAEKDKNWYEKPLEERFAIAQKALDAGAVREHHGTIDVDWSKVSDLDDKVEVNTSPPPGTEPMQTVNPPQQGAAPAGVNLRSQTSSPGIGLDGRRLTPQQMGQELARRANGRR